jgi:hypothetical protein
MRLLSPLVVVWPGTITIQDAGDGRRFVSLRAQKLAGLLADRKLHVPLTDLFHCLSSRFYAFIATRGQDIARTIEGEHLEAGISHRRLRCAGERDGANGHATGNGRRMSNSTPTGGTCPRESNRVLAHFLHVQIAASAFRRLDHLWVGSTKASWTA